MAHPTKILLIYTGGTIGMVKEYHTGALTAFDFDTLLSNIPELEQLDCAIESVSFEVPIDSSNMNPDYWVKIAEFIENNYGTHDGFVVLHGSDTMSYSASALSFMLENLGKPVIFTGSQLPIGDLRTDAKENLITAIQLAALRENNEAVIKEVGLYFEYKLYRANRTTKVNAEHFKAFNSPNYPELVNSGVHLNINTPYLVKAKNSKMALKVHKKLDRRVGILKLFTGIDRLFVTSILSSVGLRAVVMETYGAGNATTENWFLEAVANAVGSGVHIINVTQCIGGGVVMGHYDTSKALKRIGVIDGKEITTESAITKAMYLLGQNVDDSVFKTIYETSLRGEIY